MTTYNAILVHGGRGGEGRYSFEGPDDLFSRTPVRIMSTFVDCVEDLAGIGHIDYEINAAMKNERAKVATIVGEFHFAAGDTQPFMCMISPAG